MPRRRLGVALLLPPEVSNEIDGLRRALGDPALGRIVPHLTLVPPVNVRVDDLDAALAVLRTAAASVQGPLELELGPPATFLPTNPVLYLRVGGDLDALRRLRDGVFVPPLERPLTWPFVPHVTLADGIAPERVAAAADSLEAYRRGVDVEAVHLLEEQRDDEGQRRWVVLADAPFGPPTVHGRGAIETELSISDQTDPVALSWLSANWPDPQRPLSVVARREGVVVGVARGWTDGKMSRLEQLFVSEELRAEGVGRALLRAFEAECRARYASEIRLRATAGSVADALYRSRGWTEALRHPGATGGEEQVELVLEL